MGLLKLKFKKCAGPATATGHTAYSASLGRPSGGAASPTARDTHPLILSQDLSICQSNGTGLFLHPTSIDPFAARDHIAASRGRGCKGWWESKLGVSKLGLAAGQLALGCQGALSRPNRTHYLRAEQVAVRCKVAVVRGTAARPPAREDCPPRRIIAQDCPVGGSSARARARYCAADRPQRVPAWRCVCAARSQGAAALRWSCWPSWAASPRSGRPIPPRAPWPRI
jgi:hypothetical protein